MSNVIFTNNYAKFKGVMPTSDFESRVGELMNGILAKSVVLPAIQVTKDMEIVDGQCRFEAYKRLCMPVGYVVVN